MPMAMPAKAAMAMPNCLYYMYRLYPPCPLALPWAWLQGQGQAQGQGPRPSQNERVRLIHGKTANLMQYFNNYVTPKPT